MIVGGDQLVAIWIFEVRDDVQKWKAKWNGLTLRSGVQWGR